MVNYPSNFGQRQGFSIEYLILNIDDLTALISSSLGGLSGVMVRSFDVAQDREDLKVF
jgi:hypothetical protein